VVSLQGSLGASRQQHKNNNKKPTKQRKCSQSGRQNGNSKQSPGEKNQNKEANSEQNNTADVCGSGAQSNMVDSSLPHKPRQSELSRLKSNCKPEELQLLKLRCEVREFLKKTGMKKVL